MLRKDSLTDWRLLKNWLLRGMLGVAARAAAWAVAGDAAGDAQKEVFLWIVSGGLAEWEVSK